MIAFVKARLRVLREKAKVYLNHYSDPVFLSWYFNHSPKLAKFKDIHKGEDCFIIGNGPSLNKMDLSPLNYHHTFGLNKIYLLFEKIDLNLSYHVAVNSYVIQQSVKEFEALKCPSFLSYRASQNKVRHLENVYFLMTKGGVDTFYPDLRNEISEGGTVTYVAMQIAYYMGFERVFLIGVDHNFVTKGNPNQSDYLQGDDPNHFASNYFGGQMWNHPDLESSELSYQIARYTFYRSGYSIYDATLDGKLTIFQKISYDEALSMCTKK